MQHLERQPNSTREPILTPAGIRALDARLEKAGLLELAMEEAGRTVADAVQRHYPAGRVLLLAGSGANGGDALVAARHLHALGRDVVVLALPAKHVLALNNRKRLSKSGIEITSLTPANLRRELKQAAVVVDGLLGIGFSPPLRPAQAELFGLVNSSGLPVVAIDLPSGVDATVSAVEDEAIRATRTVALSGLKTALLFGPASHLAGEVTLADLRIPPGWALEEAVASRPSDAEIAPLLPVRHADAHKGTAGRVWVIGGYPGTVGAAALAGLAALRTGSGLVTLHSATDLPLISPELMIRRHADLSAALADIPEEQRPDALCIGMGLGPDAGALARQVLAWQLPTVLDADALQPELAGAGHDGCIWTPHPGEAARLLEVSTAEVIRDPVAAAQEIQERFGGVVVFKGGPTTIAHAGGVWVSRGGHPGMASAGMGDTLSGMLASLLGQGLKAPEAALVGVTLHARAGERAGEKHGYGLTASDVSAEIGAAWMALERSQIIL